jgi:hypothetical protein
MEKCSTSLRTNTSPNKAAVVMDAFTMKVGSGTLFPKAKKITDSIRLQMRTMAKSFSGSDGTLIKALLAEAQFDPEVAKAFSRTMDIAETSSGRWCYPRSDSQGRIAA